MAQSQDLTDAGIEFGKSSNGQVMFRGNGAGGFVSSADLQLYGVDPNSVGALGSAEAGWTNGRSGGNLGDTIKAFQSTQQANTERAAQEIAGATYNAHLPTPPTPTAYDTQLKTAMQAGVQPGQLSPGVANPFTSKFETGFNNASSGQEDIGPAYNGLTHVDAQGNVLGEQNQIVTPAPTGNSGNLTASDGRSVVDQYVTPDNTEQNAKLDSTFAEDPQLAQLQQERQNLVATTQTSFMADYQAMAKASGMDAIDTRMVNINKIIDGSEDSIRHEITAAGGFATERQVLALTTAANKGLIAEYKTLTQQKANTEKYLSTMIGLDEKDRAAANTRYNQISALDKQVSAREQQIQNNNVKTFEFLQKTVGFKGLLDSTGGDPYYTALIEKTLGLAPGGLAKAAQDEVKKAPAMKIIGSAKTGFYQVHPDGTTTPIKTDAPGVTNTSKTSTPKPFVFNAKQLVQLNSRGLQTSDAQGILKDIQAGHTFEDIRANMKKGGVDPHLLDDVMQIVDPKNNTPTKSKAGALTI